MAEVTPALIKIVREKTGLGLLKCKTALLENGADPEKAIDALRKQGLASAEKRMGRATSQGIVFHLVSESGKIGALLELNCETDFVTKTDDFQNLGQGLVKLLAEKNPADAEAILAQSLNGSSAEDQIKGVIAKLGENIQVGKIARIETAGKVFSYIHGDGRIGVLLALEGITDDNLGKDVCMHIAACSPSFLNSNSIPAETIEREKAIYREQIKGKPENIVEKILEGKLVKFFSDECLDAQAFVKDDSVTVGNLVKKAGGKLVAFSRVNLGN